jgi:hypothetical protein
VAEATKQRLKIDAPFAIQSLGISVVFFGLDCAIIGELCQVRLAF